MVKKIMHYKILILNILISYIFKGKTSLFIILIVLILAFNSLILNFKFFMNILDFSVFHPLYRFNLDLIKRTKMKFAKEYLFINK